jgi:hypothetical protein
MATFRKDRERRAKLLKIIENRLYRTYWAQGGQIMSTRGEDRTVASWPGARPSQIRAAAKKALDRARADVKKIKKQKAAERGDCRGAL